MGQTGRQATIITDTCEGERGRDHALVARYMCIYDIYLYTEREAERFGGLAGY